MPVWTAYRAVLRHAGALSPDRRRDGQRGASLVEFVIAFPILLMLLFGVWEFGRIYDAWQVVTNAAREGARYAATGSNDTQVRARVADYLKASYGGRLKSVDGVAVSGAGDVAATIAISHPTSTQAKVIVSAGVDIWAPAVAPLVGGGAFPITGGAIMHQ